EILPEIPHHRAHRVHRRLAEAADRGVAHDLGEVLEETLVPARRRQELDGLLRAGAAGGALAAALVLEELQEIQRDALHIVLVGKDDDGMAAEKAAVLFEQAEIERLVRQRGRQDPARGAARQEAL